MRLPSPGEIDDCQVGHGSVPWSSVIAQPQALAQATGENIFPIDVNLLGFYNYLCVRVS